MCGHSLRSVFYSSPTSAGKDKPVLCSFLTCHTGVALSSINCLDRIKRPSALTEVFDSRPAPWDCHGRPRDAGGSPFYGTSGVARADVAAWLAYACAWVSGCERARSPFVAALPRALGEQLEPAVQTHCSRGSSRARISATS